MTKIEVYIEEKLFRQANMRSLVLTCEEKNSRFGWWRNSVSRYKCLGFGRFGRSLPQL